MASSRALLLLFLIFFNFLYITANKTLKVHKPFSVSFPLTSTPLFHNSSKNPTFLSSLMATQQTQNTKNFAGAPALTYRSTFKYSMALIVTLPIGTPPQNQEMVLDTGSQLSWIQCHKKLAPKKPPPTTSFDPSLSSSFSVLPCSHPLCKPQIPDFTLPTSCDQNLLCHYSYFYADGTFAEGNLVREKITFSSSQISPPLILGCAVESGDDKGILGMNFGKLSFASQARVQKFSYCVPIRRGRYETPSGTFYLGQNPNSQTFRYVTLLTFPQSQRMPNLDPLAYTVGMLGIKIGGKILNISQRVFRPDAGGSGQTMIDSGTQYTFLVEEAYNKVREEVVRLAGRRLKTGYVYAGALDMCFNGDPLEIGRLIGDMALQFENGVEILINGERMLDEVEDEVHCVGIGRSESLGIASNIIGNFHQQNLWVEFDLSNRRVGFGKGGCSS